MFKFDWTQVVWQGVLSHNVIGEFEVIADWPCFLLRAWPHILYGVSIAVGRADTAGPS